MAEIKIIREIRNKIKEIKDNSSKNKDKIETNDTANEGLERQVSESRFVSNRNSGFKRSGSFENLKGDDGGVREVRELPINRERNEERQESNFDYSRPRSGNDVVKYESMEQNINFRKINERSESVNRGGFLESRDDFQSGGVRSQRRIRDPLLEIDRKDHLLEMNEDPRKYELKQDEKIGEVKRKRDFW